MGSLTRNRPKCLLKLYNGETIFERQIRILSECGIKDFVITTGPNKEQLIEVANKYETLKFSFVDNPEYMTTNYIVSMNNAYDYLDDDVLLLHGDLVFNGRLAEKLIHDERQSICLFNEVKELPKKDFKGRFVNNILKEVSVDIFDSGCRAFQPFYKLSKNDIYKWKQRVSLFVNKGNTNNYAEDALNEITDEITVYGMSYKDDYIEEVDTQEDYNRVSSEIKYFDYREQNIEITGNYAECLKKYIALNEEIFVVSSKSLAQKISDDLDEYKITVFDEFSPNPKYEEVKKGVKEFKKKKYRKIISIGGGSSIDMAKCIKSFSNLQNEYDFLAGKYVYSDIKHIAIPTTAGTGSESTQFAVIYYNHEKISVEHGSILPNIAILDHTLLKTLPNYEKSSALLDSLCQAIESYWANRATEESKIYAKGCIDLILPNYKNYLNNNQVCYKDILLAANYSGKAINISKTTAAHSMSYKLTQKYAIAHGHAAAICLAPIFKYLYILSKNDKALEYKLLSVANILGFDSIADAVDNIVSMIAEFNLPAVRIKKCDIDGLVDSINLERMENNPVIFTNKEIKEIYSSIT